MHHQWYYIDDLDMFGPSKFIGYKGMDAFKYVNKRGRGADGRNTERILKSELGFVSVNSEELRSKLESFLSAYDKHPNERYAVNVLPDSKYNADNCIQRLYSWDEALHMQLF